MVYEFILEPKLNHYRYLVKYACSKSDAVMLISHHSKISKDQNRKADVIRERLSMSRIKTRNDAQWPVTESFDKNQEYFVDLYRPSAEVLAFLLERDGLYDWGKEGYPEDLSFFTDNNCWLATCSHEEFGWLISDEKIPEEIEPFLQLIDQPTSLMYYEEY